MIISPQIKSFSIGPLEIHFYGLIVGLAIIAGYYLAQIRAKKYGIQEAYLDKLIIWFIPTALIGARIWSVGVNINYYSQNPLKIFAFWQGGIGILGAITASVLVLRYRSKKDKIPIYNLTDLLAPSLALGQAIGRWGNYFNQELFGSPTTLPWGLYIEEIYRPQQWKQFSTFHPAFLYESILNALTLTLLLVISRVKYIPSGTITAFYLICYGATRILIELIRVNPDQNSQFGNIRLASIISLVFILSGLVILHKINFVKQIKKGYSES